MQGLPWPVQSPTTRLAMKVSSAVGDLHENSHPDGLGNEGVM